MSDVLPSFNFSCRPEHTYFSRVNFTVSSLWVATMIFAFLLCSISSSTYSKHLDKQQGKWSGSRHFLAELHRALVISQHLLVIHPVGGLIVWVYWVFVANLFGPVSLLVHVGSTNQFGTKVPALPSWQLNIHSYIAVGILKVLKNTKGYPYRAGCLVKQDLNGKWSN